MPLTPKQARQKRHIEDSAGSKEPGDRIFYAMERQGRITGGHKKKRKRSRKKRRRV